MTNFFCLLCGEKMILPPEVKKKVSKVTHVFWHEDCASNPKIKMTDEQRKFYQMTGKEF